MRKEINGIVRAFAKNNNNCYEQAWNDLYKFYNKVMRNNVKSRATRRHIKPLDVVENDGNLEILKILAENLYVA